MGDFMDFHHSHYSISKVDFSFCIVGKEPKWYNLLHTCQNLKISKYFANLLDKFAPSPIKGTGA